MIALDPGRAAGAGSSRAASSTGCATRPNSTASPSGPIPATHDHNTLGGMIGNDSCGVHSVTAGRTADNVERLTSSPMTGCVLDVGPTERRGARSDPRARAAAAATSTGKPGGVRRCYGRPDREALSRRSRASSRATRISTQLLPGSGFNVAAALIGTEGSCVARPRSDAEARAAPALPGAGAARLRRRLRRRRRGAVAPASSARSASRASTTASSTP